MLSFVSKGKSITFLVCVHIASSRFLTVDVGRVGKELHKFQLHLKPKLTIVRFYKCGNLHPVATKQGLRVSTGART